MKELIFNDDAEKAFDETENAYSFYKLKYGISNKKICKNGKEIEVSGECVYNFGKRYEKLKEIINKEQDSEKKGNLTDSLELCRKLHHSLPNIMVLPKNGGLNIEKGKIYFSKKNEEWRVRKAGFYTTECFDRPDILVCYIYDYYKEKQYLNKKSFKEIGEYLSNGIFTASIMHGENFTVLLDILDSFNDIYEFCSSFYQIDDGMVKDWLNGKEFKIENDIEQYLNQAFAFWEIQMENIFKMLLDEEDTCIVINGEDIKEYVQGQLSEYTDKNQLILEKSEDSNGCYVLRKNEYIS